MNEMDYLRSSYQELEQKYNKKVEKLRESEYLFDLINENANDMIAIINDKFEFEYVNEKAHKELLGYSRNNLIGKASYKGTHPDDLKRGMKALRNAFKTGKGSTEVRYKHKEGHYVWIEIRGKAFNDKEGKTKAVTIARDITKRKNSEQKLKKSEEKFRSTFEQAAVCIAHTDPDGAFLRINQKFCDLLGYNHEELLSLSFQDITYPDDVKGNIEAKNNLLSNKIQTYITEKRYIRKDGSFVWVNLTVSVKRDANGVSEYFIAVAEDICKRKKVEQKLKESEEKYRTLFESSKDAIVMTGLDGQILDCNPAYTEMLGYSIEELKELTFHQLTPEKWHEWEAEILQKQFIERGYSDEYEKEYIRKDGTIFPVSLRGWSIKDEQGDITSLWGFVRDITERKKAEEKLKESEKKYRTLVSNIPGAVFRSDENWKIQYMTDKIEDITGYPSSDFIGDNVRTYASIIHPEDLKMVEDISSDCITKRLPIRIEYRVIRGDGSVRWVHDNAQGVFDENGELQSYDGVVFDITERKLAEKKLINSEKRYKQLANELEMILDHIPGIVVYKDTENNIVRVNKFLADAHNLKKEELEGKNCFHLYPKDQAQAYWDDDLEVIRSRLPKLNIEEPWEPKEGKRWVNTSKIPYIDESGDVKGIIAIALDITDRKKVEEELINLNKLKSELLTRASHELKTPLISIKGYSDLLLELHKEKFDDMALSSIKHINRGCEALEKTVNNILNATYLESDQVSLNLTVEDLSFLIKFVVNDLQGLAMTRKHDISVNIQNDMIIKIEKERIYEVLSNLVVNAIKYTPPGGHVEIKSEKKNGSYVIIVKDNGIGFTKEEKEQIFKQFGKIERYGQGWDVGIEGTGLGLFISKRLIELHGGKIWMESNGRNKGSSFYFSLPIT